MDEEKMGSVFTIVLSTIAAFVVCFFLYGVYLLIIAPSADEKMAEKGYVRIVVNDGVSRVGQWVWVPSNSTEYKLYLKSLTEK